MGTGKTCAGREIARRLGREFVDMDALIEAREGMTVAEIFRQRGEAHFRCLEAALCRELANRSALVIATGGKTLVPGTNREILGASGTVVCLTASSEEILRRLEGVQDRPLLDTFDQRARVPALLEERAEAYRCILLQVDTTGLTVEEVVDQVLAIAATPRARSIPVQVPGGEYAIQLGRALLDHVGTLLAQHGFRDRAILVTNPTVNALLGARVVRSLEAAGFDVGTCMVPDGETFKTLDTVRTLYDDFTEAGLDRLGPVLALGGGVIGDIAGFAAATYLRGVPLVQLPTSLLAMVDASVGGKVAVNHSQGKNLIGAFKQPALVVADLDTLATLPAPEFSSGLAEIVKAGLIGDPQLLNQIGACGPVPVAWLIERAVRVKVRIVEADPFETGQRATLNLGHTFGHALELLSNYSRSHGYAVAIGLVAAARLSARLAVCDSALPVCIEHILAPLGLPTRYHDHTPAQVWQAMVTDKKRRGSRLRFVLLRGEGDVFVADDVSQEDVLAVLEALRET